MKKDKLIKLLIDMKIKNNPYPLDLVDSERNTQHGKFWKFGNLVFNNTIDDVINNIEWWWEDE